MSEDPAVKAQREMIEAARALLRPTPVKLHHVPNWFRMALLRGFGCADCRTSGEDVLHYAIDCVRRRNYFSSWLDHWGSTAYQSRPNFVSEPYNITEDNVKEIAEIARKSGCKWFLTANSWWFPGATIRIAFYQENP